MPEFTNHYGLETLTQGEAFALNGQKYTTTDRDTIDRLLYAGAEGHHHSGVGAVQNNPNTALALTLHTSVGGLPAGTRIYYVYTWVDASGFETAPSPEAFVDTAAAVLAPVAPLAVASSSGGSLVGSGGYFYALSAYTLTSSAETPLGASAFVTTPAGTTSSVTLTYPAKPSGATGFNIYRRAPGDAGFYFLVSVDMSGTPPTTHLDDGGVAETYSRAPTFTNTTNSTNSVTVTLPGSPAVVPTGFTWNLYRSFASGSYLNALVSRVVPVLGVEPLATVDTGTNTGMVSPPLTTQLVATPTKINLVTETVGVLPTTAGTYPVVVTFSFPGTLSAQVGKVVWVCEFATAKIVSARAALARGSHPASVPVIVDVLKGSGATPTYTTIYGGATPPAKPQVPVTWQVGLPAPPATTTLVFGDTLSADIIQAGGGATPTDHDVTIDVLLVVSGVGLP